MKRIVTLGTSFCGSTLLDLLLERAAVEVTGVGEIHHAHDSSHSPWCYPCLRQKIHDCPLNKAIIAYRESDAGPMELYEFVGKALGIDVIHTSDKASCFVKKHSVYDEMDAIILYKHPLRAFASHRRHYPDGPLNFYASTWETIYGHAIRSTCKRKLYLRYEDLCKHTEAALQAICNTFDLTYDPTWVDTWQDIAGRHRIGGNSLAIQGTQLEAKPIKVDNGWVDLLTQEEKAMAREHMGRFTYMTLERKAHNFG